MARRTNTSTNHFHYTIQIENTQEKVWSFLTNVDRWNEWDTELLSSNLLGKFCLDAQGVLVPKTGPKLKFHISRIVPNTSYTFITRLPVGTLVITRTLENNGNSTLFTDDIQFKGMLKHLFGFLLGSGFKKTLPSVMENFKRIAEQE